MRSCSACISSSSPVGSTLAKTACGLAVGERPEPGDAHLHGRAMHAVERVDDLVGHPVIDVTDEAQCDVIVLGIDPARTAQSAAQKGEHEARLGRDLKPGEQSRHGMALRCLR